MHNSRSSAETVMNPIGQTIPVIHLHLKGNSEQPLQLLNLGRFKTSSGMYVSYHILFSSIGTNIQIPTVNNVSRIVAEIYFMTTVSIIPPVHSKYLEKKKFSYPTDLVQVASITRMTSTIVFRIRCYVSVITEKYDLSFQLTYHTLAFDFQTANAEEQALLDMSKIQTVVLDLQTSNILLSVNYLPISSVATKDFHFKDNQRILKTKRYCIQKIPFIGEKIEMVNAP